MHYLPKLFLESQRNWTCHLCACQSFPCRPHRHRWNFHPHRLLLLLFCFENQMILIMTNLSYCFNRKIFGSIAWKMGFFNNLFLLFSNGSLRIFFFNCKCLILSTKEATVVPEQVFIILILRQHASLIGEGLVHFQSCSWDAGGRGQARVTQSRGEPSTALPVYQAHLHRRKKW